MDKEAAFVSWYAYSIRNTISVSYLRPHPLCCVSLHPNVTKTSGFSYSTHINWDWYTILSYTAASHTLWCKLGCTEISDCFAYWLWCTEISDCVAHWLMCTEISDCVAYWLGCTEISDWVAHWLWCTEISDCFAYWLWWLKYQIVLPTGYGVQEYQIELPTG